MKHPNRGEPTPAIALEGDGALPRFAGVDIADELLTRLGSACSEVSTDGAACVEASRDWWPLAMIWALDGVAPARAAAVARPADATEVAAVLKICNEARVPVTTVAGRSGVCGASVPAFGGVALDMTAMAGIVDVDRESLLLDVLPGKFGDILEDQLRADHGVTLGHWPQSINLSTVGGWLACRSAGQYSTRYGKIEDMVAGLDAVLADGTVVRTGGHAPRSATGPDLAQLFVGSEGTLGVITAAQLRVHPAPPAERRAAYGFASFETALDACRRVLRRGATPAVLRLYDERESKRYAEETNVLLVFDEGDPAIVDATMAIVSDECAEADRLDDGLVEQWMGHRNDVSALEDAIRGGFVVDTTEIAARWSALPALYRDGVTALKDVEGIWVASAHQSHAYIDGACLYFTWAGQPVDGSSKDDLYRRAWEAIMQATVANGGAISHHHGIGLNRAPWMPEELGDAGFAVLTQVKAALDPNGILNPGKLGLPSPFGAPPWP